LQYFLIPTNKKEKNHLKLLEITLLKKKKQNCSKGTTKFQPLKFTQKVVMKYQPFRIAQK